MFVYLFVLFCCIFLIFSRGISNVKCNESCEKRKREEEREREKKRAKEKERERKGENERKRKGRND